MWFEVIVVGPSVHHKRVRAARGGAVVQRVRVLRRFPLEAALAAECSRSAIAEESASREILCTLRLDILLRNIMKQFK